MTRARQYAGAGLSGVLLGVVMLGAFTFAGRGIGASGAFAAVTGGALRAVAPAAAAAFPANVLDRIPTDAVPWSDWAVIEVIGLMVGGALSARLARRREASARPDIEEGTNSRWRALAGGVLMGVGARLAWGCTSGLALSGGALLVTGAWVFTPVAFATAILITRLVTRAATETA